jgi:hypoxanthine-guanine phosphoribosyltransferase
LAIESLLVNPSRITVVDDVLTKGATLLAVTSIVKTHVPNADVRAFAMLRTMGLQPDVEAIVAPCVGTITLTATGEAWRSP